MGGEEEIVRIARRLDKMVAKKSAVSGGGWGAGAAPGLGSSSVSRGLPPRRDPFLAAGLWDTPLVPRCPL